MEEGQRLAWRGVQLPNGPVCHIEAFAFYVKDSGELLKDFNLGYDMSRNENLKDYYCLT